MAADQNAIETVMNDPQASAPGAICSGSIQVTSPCALFEHGLAEQAIGAAYIANCHGGAMPRYCSTTRTGLRR